MAEETKALTLYEIEDDLLALLNTEEMVEGEDHLAILAEIAEKTETAVAKRDNVIRFIRHIELQILGAKDEETRIRDLRKSWEASLLRMRNYIAGVIEEFGVEPKKGAKRLEGKLGILAMAKNPDSIEVDDPSALPPAMFDAELKMTGRELRDMEAELGHPAPGLISIKPKKSAIKAAMAKGDVPGADVQIGGVSLRIR